MPLLPCRDWSSAAQGSCVLHRKPVETLCFAAFSTRPVPDGLRCHLFQRVQASRTNDSIFIGYDVGAIRNVHDIGHLSRERPHEYEKRIIVHG